MVWALPAVEIATEAQNASNLRARMLVLLDVGLMIESLQPPIRNVDQFGQ
jgi:hypothetical protein